jgi:hypothetical protein
MAVDSGASASGFSDPVTVGAADPEGMSDLICMTTKRRNQRKANQVASHITLIIDAWRDQKTRGQECACAMWHYTYARVIM